VTERRIPPSPDVPAWYTEHTALTITTLKWTLLGAVAGLCVGLGTRAFLWALAVSAAAVGRGSVFGVRPYYLLPLALPACVWLIRRFAPSARGHGTEAVIAAVHTDSGRIDWAVAPIKLSATILTLAFGGSVGKEGPCAQIGAAMTSGFADCLRLDDEDRRRLVICGIGAGFAAVFGTPVSGALFGIEVLYLGRIEYGVLFPCLVAGIVAHLVCGVPPPVPVLHESVGSMSQLNLVWLAIVFGATCGLVALTFIELMRILGRALHRHVGAHPYRTAAAGGALLAGLFTAAGDLYAGLGTPTIEASLTAARPVPMLAPLVKMLATSVTLEIGGSGGIVTPLFFVGSTSGAAFAQLFHLPVGMFAAFGFVALVAAAANTPIAAAVMGMELLPAPLGVYGALCAGAAFLMVGHRSVYPSQRLGLTKSAGLELPLHGPVGDVDRSGLRIRQNSLTDRTLRLRRHLRVGRPGSRRRPRE
jgi:H+/Cl- antiporter ClcA